MLLAETNLVVGPFLLDRQPPRPACLSVKIANDSDGTGTVTIEGTVGGVAPVFDPIIFYGPASGETEEIVDGVEEFEEVTQVATLGFACDGMIEIKAVTPSGQPIYTEITIFDEMPCWCDLHHGGVIVQIPGGVITSVTKLFTKYNPLMRILENDIIYFRDRKYRVDFVEETFTKSKVIPHHLELILKQAKTNED